jgi:hypothetical protein
MSLEDRTNEIIRLSMHAPLPVEGGAYEAEIVVDLDSDSSFTPSHWVDISLTDSDHDSDPIRLTMEETALLHDRLGRILRPTGGIMSSVRTARKKPVEIQALLYTGDNGQEVGQFVGEADRNDQNQFLIHTLEGTMAADPGDWIIRGVKGEFYPCKPDIFDATYELVPYVDE